MKKQLHHILPLLLCFGLMNCDDDEKNIKPDQCPACPVIYSLEPESGRIGEIITLRGKNFINKFGSEDQMLKVFLGDIAVPLVSSDYTTDSASFVITQNVADAARISPDTALQVKVEVGNISSEEADGNPEPVYFSYLFHQITAIEPPAVRPGGVLNIHGNYFEQIAANNEVSIGGEPLSAEQLISANDTLIQVTVPETSSGGKVEIGIQDVVVAGPTLQIAKTQVHAVSQEIARHGDTLIIHGQFFESTVADNEVVIGGRTAEIIEAQEDQLTVVVPQAGPYQGNPVVEVDLTVNNIRYEDISDPIAFKYQYRPVVQTMKDIISFAICGSSKSDCHPFDISINLQQEIIISRGHSVAKVSTSDFDNVQDATGVLFTVVASDTSMHDYSECGSTMCVPKSPLFVPEENSIYIADYNNGRIMKASHGGIVDYAGSGTVGYQDGNNPMFYLPYGIAYHDDKLFVLEETQHTRSNTRTARTQFSPIIIPIRPIINPNPIIVPVNPELILPNLPKSRIRLVNGSSASTLTSSRNMYHDIISSPSGNHLFVTVQGAYAGIAKIDMITGENQQFTGSNELAITDGPLAEAGFVAPKHITDDANGNLILTDGSAIRFIDMQREEVHTIAGSATSIYRDNYDDIITDPLFYDPQGIVTDDDHNIYVIDQKGTYGNIFIRRISMQ